MISTKQPYQDSGFKIDDVNTKLELFKLGVLKIYNKPLPKKEEPKQEEPKANNTEA